MSPGRGGSGAEKKVCFMGEEALGVELLELEEPVCMCTRSCVCVSRGGGEV